MKVKENLLLKKFGDDYIVVAVDDAADDFNGLITLSESAAFAWKCMQTETTYDEVLSKLEDEYDADTAVIKADLDNMLENLRLHKLLDE